MALSLDKRAVPMHTPIFGDPAQVSLHVTQSQVWHAHKHIKVHSYTIRTLCRETLLRFVHIQRSCTSLP